MIPANYTICLEDIKSNEEFLDILNKYPIYDEDYRKTLNEKIISHYKYEEIAFETPHLFCHHLKIKLDEIMPKYNMLYKSEILKADPLSNFSYTEKMEKLNTDNLTSNSTNEGTSTSNSSTEDKSTIDKNSSDVEKHAFENTPQGDLSNQTIETLTYATTMNYDSLTNDEFQEKNSNTKINDTTTNSSTNNTTNDRNSTENYVKRITGNSNISTTKLFTEFVNNFNSIDKLIIDELYDLFMQIY